MINRKWASVIAVLAACSGGVQVETDYAPDAVLDMQSYQTYRWLQPAEGQTRVDNELIDSRIESAVNATMQSKGLRLVTSGDADFGVGFQAARDERTEYRTTSTER